MTNPIVSARILWRSDSDRLYESLGNFISQLLTCSTSVIEVCGLDDAELGDLARKTTIFVSTVGPYAIYGEHAFKACAENGTHYLDVTGEAPWVHKMIKKYEKSAKSSGAIMIPQIGVDSSPADLVTWSLVSFIRKKCSAPTADLVLSIHELRYKKSDFF